MPELKKIIDGIEKRLMPFRKKTIAGIGKQAESFRKKTVGGIGKRFELFCTKKPKNVEMFRREKRIRGVASKTAAVFFSGWFLASLLAADFLLPVFFGFFSGAIAAVFFWQLPKWGEKERAERVEAELPFVLLGISVELRLQRPFERILEKAGQSDFRFAAAEFQKASDEIRIKGASVSESLRHLSERVSGTEAKRAIIQLVHSYEQGTRKNRGLEVKRMAAELLAKQRIQAKAFGSQLALFSLVFITVSAIVPALFQSFVLVGSAFLNLDFSALQALLIIAIGFPMLDALVLLLIRLKTPVFLR